MTSNLDVAYDELNQSRNSSQSKTERHSTPLTTRLNETEFLLRTQRQANKDLEKRSKELATGITKNKVEREELLQQSSNYERKNEAKARSNHDDLQGQISSLTATCKAKDDQIYQLQKHMYGLEEKNKQLDTLNIKQQETMKEFQNKIKEYQTKYQKEEMDNNLLKAQIAELNNTIGRKDIEINDAKYEKKRLESDNAKLLRKICDLNELLSTTNTGASSCMKNNAHQESKSDLKQPTTHNIRSTKERKPLQILNDNLDSTLDLLPKKRSSSNAVLSDNKKKPTIINETAINPIVIEDDRENEQDTASHKHIKIRTNTDKKQKENLTSMSSANIPTSTMNSRHRHDRAHLKGDTCVSCAKFYGNEALPAQLNDRNVYLTGQDRIQLHSRHRGQRATTPPGFWTVGFASPPEKEFK